MSTTTAHTQNVDDGFRRILYDAMILSASLRAVLECSYYHKHRPEDIRGDVETHQANALIQIRSMVDFLSCKGREIDDMTAVQIPGCIKHNLDFDERTAINKYAGHKTWAAAQKDVEAIKKPELVTLALK